MLEYQRSLKAKKIKQDQLPSDILNEINNLAKIEKNLIQAEKDGNDELVDELNSQFLEMDSNIADKIDDFEPKKEEPKKEEPKKEEPKKEEPKKEESEEGGNNTGLVLGVLGLIGLGIAYFVGVRKK